VEAEFLKFDSVGGGIAGFELVAEFTLVRGSGCDGKEEVLPELNGSCKFAEFGFKSMGLFLMPFATLVLPFDTPPAAIIPWPGLEAIGEVEVEVLLLRDGGPEAVLIELVSIVKTGLVGAGLTGL
jgi:hypothetical protein